MSLIRFCCRSNRNPADGGGRGLSTFSIWSNGLYLSRRVLGHLQTEDGRYRQLRQDWAANLDVKMFQFFQFQALLLVALSVPFHMKN